MPRQGDELEEKVYGGDVEQAIAATESDLTSMEESNSTLVTIFVVVLLGLIFVCVIKKAIEYSFAGSNLEDEEDEDEEQGSKKKVIKNILKKPSL
eukprot:CAMPEP_0170481518 /NCGR_PEP_ID=MMETSP0208-20121228/1936_1 /TAXON_ID=197538 /ORGANISM="Strombidium inclinatum, Strain S3" /LENGTH=94 /DNA_ID=CAMNT_0010754237 /DNA_START=8 /DNA_END=292 /DNA_ORIENTATION=+